jgi:hypothetical protein
MEVVMVSYRLPALLSLARWTGWLLALALLPGLAGAKWVDLGGDPLSITLLESDGERSLVRVTLGGLEADPVTIDGSVYYTIGLEGQAVQPEVGFPALPDARASLIIPDDREMSVTLLDAKYVDLTEMPIAPSKGNLPRTVNPADVPYTFGPIYAGGGTYPATAVEGHDPYILRDFRGMVVDANVFQATPSTRTLRVYTEMTIEIAPAGVGVINVLERTAPIASMDRQFALIYQHHFLNFENDRYTPVLEDGELLIIAYDSFRDAMLPFYRWKLQKGVPAKLVTVTQAGGTATAIKNYILAEYGATNLGYVLLVGDAAQVPTFMVGGGGSDPTYSLLAGGDNYPEIFIGRFSAENLTHVNTQVDRSVTYERDPMAGGAWYPKGTGIGSDQGPGHFNEYDYQHENLIRADLLAYGYASIDQIYDPGATAAMVSAALNEGRSILNYTGHGSDTSWGTTGFSNSNVAALTNDYKLPFIQSVACYNGNFTAGTCFGEAWLRSTHNGLPIGAVAAYMSSISQAWDPPMYAQDASADLLVGDDMRTVGGLWFNGSCEMIDLQGSAGATEFLAWTIFGDPSLAVFTKTPQAMTVNHSGALLLGQGDYAVSVPGVSGALCALYANEVLYGSAVTGPGGAATIQLPHPPTEPMTLALTVTAYNRVTYVGTVEVVPADGPYLVLGQLNYVDGNGDGILNAGESVNLRVQLRNVGSEPATGISATIATIDPYITITHGTQTYPDIPAGSSTWSDGFYTFAIAPDCPNQEAVSLTCAITGAGRDTWDAAIAFVVSAPAISVASVAVDDVAGGDGNGRLDPGESATLSMTLLNGGSYALNTITGVLSCGHPQVTIDPDTGTNLGLGPAGSGALAPPFGIAIDPAYPFTTVGLTLRVTGSNSFDLPIDVMLPVGGFYEPVENGSLGWTHAVVSGGGFVDQWHMSTERNHTAGGMHSWKCGDSGTGTYADLNDAGLITPPVVLAGEGELRFWHTMDAEVSGIYPGRCYDGGLLEISIDGGAFTQITPVGGYPYTIRPGGTPGPFADGTPVFSGTHDWQQVSFDLSGISGTVVLRWRFGSDGNTGREGWYVDDVEIIGTSSSSAAPEGEPRPVQLTLSPCTPNPFRAAAQLQFGLPRSGAVELQVFDATGRLVRTLLKSEMPAGRHTVAWTGDDDAGRRVANGLYYYRLRTPEATQQRGVVVLR